MDNLTLRSLQHSRRYKSWRFLERYQKRCVDALRRSPLVSNSATSRLISWRLRRFRTPTSPIFVMPTKRRRRVLTGSVEEDIRNLLSAKAAELDCEIPAMEIMPGHVHLFLNCPPTLSPSDAMFWLKGYSSRILREKYAGLGRMPSIWTGLFFESTAENVSSDTIQKYIR